MKNKILSIYSIFLIALLFSIQLFDNILLVYLLFGSIIFLIFKPTYIFPIYFISTLGRSVFAIEEGWSLSRILSVILIISLVLNILLNRNHWKEYIPLKLIIGLILLNFISTITSITLSFNSFLLMLQNLLILYLFSSHKSKDILDLSKILQYSSYFITLLVIYQMNAEGVNFTKILYRTTFEDVNANRMAMMFVQLGVINAYGMFTSKKSTLISKFLSILFLVINLLLILITGSRTAFLAITLAIIFTYFILYRSLSLKKVLVIAVPLLLLMIAWDYLYNIIFFLDRYTYEGIIGSGGYLNRFYSVGLVISEIIPNNIFFGVGIGGDNIIEALKPYGYMVKPSHNIFLDTLAQFGLFGFLIYFIFIFRIIKKIINHIRYSNELIYLPILLISSSLINGLGENVFMEKFFWSGLALGLFIVNNQNIESYQTVKRD